MSSTSYHANSDYNSGDDNSAPSNVNATKTTNVSPWNNSSDNDSDYFTNAGSDDFRQQSGDLQIDVGQDLSGTFTTDCVGTNRGTGADTWDLGFYELFQVSTGGVGSLVNGGLVNSGLIGGRLT